MRCPCCDAPEFVPRSLGQKIGAQIGKLAIVVASVTVAVFGQAELLGEPWRHWVTVLAIVVAVGVSVAVSFQEGQQV